MSEPVPVVPRHHHPSAIARQLGISVQHLHRLCLRHRLARVNLTPSGRRATWKLPTSTVEALRALFAPFVGPKKSESTEPIEPPSG